MAILQALFTMLSRSLGKILNAIFGWAVVALFGQTSPTQKTLLSALVAVAAAWPILLLGIAFPRVAAMVLAFVPPSAQGPTWLMRSIWIVLALLVPVTVGLVVAAKAPPGSPREPFVVRALRGFPITIGLAGAFLLTFVSVPVLRVAAVARRRKDEHVPIITAADGYDELTHRIDKLLLRHGIDADRADPPWWLAGPSKVLLAMGGRAFRGFIPARLGYWVGPSIEIALYPSDLLARGRRQITAYTHGVITEDLVQSAALQTFEPASQELERQIRRVWRVFAENPAAHTGSTALRGRLEDITNQLSKVDVPYEEWSILYRQCAQLSRAIEGQPQLLAKGKDMTHEPESTSQAAALPNKPSPTMTGPTSDLSTSELVLETTREALTLIKSEIELAKTELKADVKSEIAAAKGLGLGVLGALAALNLLLVSGALGLATVMPAWAAALVVTAVVALLATIAGAIGWKHVKTPLARTRKSLEEDARWVKERAA